MCFYFFSSRCEVIWQLNQSMHEFVLIFLFFVGFSQFFQTSEILVIGDNNYQEFYLPFNEIGKLSKLTGVNLRNLRVVTRLHPSICDWTELRYFAIQAVSFANGTTTPDCIGEKWNKIQYFALYSSTRLNDDDEYLLPQKLFDLSTVETIHLLNWKLDFTFFRDFDSFSSSLVNVNFEWSNICDKYIVNGTNITVSNITYLDYIASDNNQLINFIDKYDPCWTPCNSAGFCTADEWGDGICDALCDKGSCGYDQCKVHTFFVFRFLWVILGDSG